MNRFHVHVRVPDIAQSIGFYSTLFGVSPSVVKPDYAKWMLDDPRVNFAISLGGADAKGIDHLGIQVEADHELRGLAARLKAAGEKTRDEEAVTCCYAKGNKSWVNDPSGVRWETFYTFGEATIYGEDRDAAKLASVESSACCA
jgi:catechol 2,3-dioxygenase-like lactoylglutathione lyase family enzyme